MRDPELDHTEIVIIGAGLAGASVAYHLAIKGLDNLLILEKEPIPGFHASGRNAAVVHQTVSDEVICILARESSRFFMDPPAPFPLPLNFNQNGSLLIVEGKGEMERLQREAGMQRRAGVPVEVLGPSDLTKRVPLLSSLNLSGGSWCPTDGVIDIHSLLQGFLKGATCAGARLQTGCEVKAILTEGRKVTGVITSSGRLNARMVVNAAGAWAGHIGEMAGVKAPLKPFRRHLVVTEPIPGGDPSWPFVWNLSDPFYFRPESGGLLLSPCDEEEFHPCDPPVDMEIIEMAASKASRFFPSLAGAGIIRSWACLRTLTPDHRFIIGEDPDLKGFFWVAGLGGHGVTCSPIIGRIAADLILYGRTDIQDLAYLSPGRFL